MPVPCRSWNRILPDETPDEPPAIAEKQQVAQKGREKEVSGPRRLCLRPRLAFDYRQKVINGHRMTTSPSLRDPLDPAHFKASLGVST